MSILFLLLKSILSKFLNNMDQSLKTNENKYDKSIQISIKSIPWKISKVYDIFATMELLYN